MADVPPTVSEAELIAAGAMPADTDLAPSGRTWAEEEQGRTAVVLPLPNEQFDGDIVVASVWQRDDVAPETALLLTLRPEPLYYRVRDIEMRNGEWVVTVSSAFPNIVPAVRDYEDRGGDY